MTTETYRYERKFLVDQLDQHQVMGLIKRHPSMFSEPFPPRFINNFYLDTADMEHYHDNVGGAANRRKVRIRWYGDLLGQIEGPVLEFKIKRGLVGTKKQHPYPSFNLNDGVGMGAVMSNAGAAELPADVTSYLRMVSIVLMNRYHRRYYASADGRFRLTLDTGMTFYRVGGLSTRFAHKQTDHRNTIVELKYGIDEDASAPKVSGFFPFRVTKSSKYVQGIERVYL